MTRITALDPYRKPAPPGGAFAAADLAPAARRGTAPLEVVPEVGNGSAALAPSDPGGTGETACPQPA
jgi:hypothetical protein